MDASSLIVILPRLLLLLAGLLLPGSMILRALRLPWSCAAAFLVSSTLLYLLVIGFGLAGLPITLTALALTLTTIAVIARLVPAKGKPEAISPSFACFTRLGGWTPLYLLFWSVVGWRLTTQPLTGPDVYFRWSWLAEQIVHHGSAGFYPPVSGDDFVRYFWAESIPPGIASLYTWAYLCGGGTQALWTSPVVALQLLALHELAWRLGSRWGGEVVARRAVILVAACPLLTWSVLIGQETGFLAVAVCALAWGLGHLRDAAGHRWAVLTGLFAVAAASTREYGVAFAVAGIGLALLSGIPRTRLLILAAVTLPLSLAWPLLVYLLTGNPVHSLDVAGLFPVNPMFIAWSAVFHAPHANALATSADWLDLGRYLLLWALPALLGAASLAYLLSRRLRDAHIPAVLAMVSVVLWYWSLPYTAGGVFYSLRVLSPALALLAVAGAYGLTSFVPAQGSRIVVAGVALMLTESLPKTLVLPQNPYQAKVAEWSTAGRQFTDSVRNAEQALVTQYQSLPPAQRILSDNAGLPRVFAPLGVEVVPVWSPAVSWLFDPKAPADLVARRWRQAGIRYLILGRSASGLDFVMQRARWRAPYFTVQTVGESGQDTIIEVTATLPGEAVSN